MKTVITAQCLDQTLILTNSPKLASGGENEFQVELTFDEYWNGFGKEAVFYRDESRIYRVVLTNNIGVIPWELTAEPGKVHMSIRGASGSTVRTSSEVVLSFVQGAPLEGKYPAPLPDVYRQVLSAEGMNEQAIKAEAHARAVEIAAERARIDNLVSGGTVDDAELLDVRVGTDGTTYASAGAAVREQLKGLDIPKSAKYILQASIQVDTTAGTISFVENEGMHGFVYTSGEYLWTLNYSDHVIDYKAITASVGEDASYAYVIDTVENKFVFKRLYDGFTTKGLTRGDVVLFVCMASASGVIGQFTNFANATYFNGEQKPYYTDAIWPWNHIIGSLGGRIDIDTSAKTLHMNGLFFFETGMWKSVDKTLNLSSFTMPDGGGTVRITLNAAGELAITGVEKPAKKDDIFICEIFASGSWAFDHTRIYTSHSTKSLIYVDDVAVVPDCRAMRAEVDALKNHVDTNRRTCNIFKKVVCCGDSYTSGHMTDTDGVVHATMIDYAWPAYMSKLTGNNWVNCGQSGANVISWQSSGYGLPKAQTAGKAQAYVIGLMINDVGPGANAIPLGSSADIGTEAATYYGGMSKIVRELNAISPEAKIFIQTCPNTGGAYPQYNQAVKDIVAAYESTYPVHCLDLLAHMDLYANSSLTGDANDGHYTAAGYEQFAEILAVIMSEYINNNISDFKNVAFIEYDA